MALLAVVLLAAALIVGLPVWQGPSPPQQPVFRSTVDLIAVDVQVLDRTGLPVVDLHPESFVVTLNGKSRRVVSAELVRHATSDAPVRALPSAGPIATNQWPVATGTGRVFDLAIDTSSFDATVWQRASAAARRFLAQLSPADRVGLYAFPFGPAIPPTLDHAAVRRALQGLTGNASSLRTQYQLSPAEVIDISAETARLGGSATAVRRVGQTALDPGADAPTVLRVQDRECPADPNCSARIILDATAAAQDYESKMAQSVNGLRGMLDVLREWPGRKTVVLLSAGLIVSDRVGGRPAAEDLADSLGHQLAQANAVIYTVHVDRAARDGYSAATKRMSTTSDSAREASMRARWLDEFSIASGGALFSAQVDDGEVALGRVFRETSAYYLLGVEPVPGDRDGKLREVDVKVRNVKNATVRSRNWVIIPKK